jgi:TRAP-type C4-dicarboxylate transport system permease small subunit
LLPSNEHYGKKEKRMERFFKYALPFLISVVAAMQFYQVVMRYIFEIPVMGLDEMIVYPTLWLYILGSVNAAREDTQIKANVLDVFLKTARARLIVRVIADFFSVVISSWLTYWAWDYFKYAKRVWKESPTLYIPTFWAECALFIGLVIMTIYCVIYFIKNIRLLVAPLQTTEEI